MIWRYLAVCWLLFLPAGLSLSGEKNYRVVWVVDGDTIKIHTEQLIRYIGIDTPEIRKKRGGKWKYDPDPYGEEAKRYNMKLVRGKRVRLEFDVNKRDRYGRLLAYVFVGDTFVNLEMIRQGYANLLTIPPNLKYTDAFRSALKEAKENRRGMWSGT